MTPTEQAADRVKALVEERLVAARRSAKHRAIPPTTTEEALSEVMEHATLSVGLSDLTSLLSALTALQARVEEAEKARDRSHDLSLHAAAELNRMDREAAASAFVLALMAAAAERSYPQSTVDSILRAAFPLALTSERSQFLALLTPPLEQE